jgi:hypothetical protein
MLRNLLDQELHSVENNKYLHYRINNLFILIILLLN